MWLTFKDMPCHLQTLTLDTDTFKGSCNPPQHEAKRFSGASVRFRTNTVNLRQILPLRSPTK